MGALPAPPKSLSTTAYTMAGFFGYTARPIRPVRGGSPLVFFFQVCPPSSERKMPPVSPTPLNDQGVRRREYIAA